MGEGWGSFPSPLWGGLGWGNTTLWLNCPYTSYLSPLPRGERRFGPLALSKGNDSSVRGCAGLAGRSSLRSSASCPFRHSCSLSHDRARRRGGCYVSVRLEKKPSAGTPSVAERATAAGSTGGPYGTGRRSALFHCGQRRSIDRRHQLCQ